MFKKQKKQQETEQYGSILYLTHRLPRTMDKTRRSRKLTRYIIVMQLN